jgi:RNA polymerase sigma factor (TIGR02999 family)
MCSLNRTTDRKPDATPAFFAALYAELHSMARRLLARHGGPISPGTTTLLHQTYLNFAERNGTSFPDRLHFMAYAARVMRGLIVDDARRRRQLKRGGRFEITFLNAEAGHNPVDNRNLILLSDALDELATLDTSLAELVDLKFFGGFTFSEIAAMRGVSERTVQRNWEKARIYLHRSMRPDLALRNRQC